jgi:hypothetical protein
MSSPSRTKPRFHDKLKSIQKIIPDIFRSASPSIAEPTDEGVANIGPDSRISDTTPRFTASGSSSVGGSVHLGRSPTPSIPPNVYATFLSDPSQEGPSGRMANAANVGFEGLKTTLRAIKEASDVFVPLKSAVGGLLALIDLVEVCIVTTDRNSLLIQMPINPFKTEKITQI